MKIFLWGIVVTKIKRNKGAQIKRKIIIKLFPLSRSFPFWWSRGAASGSPRAKRAAKPQRSNRQRGAGYGIQSVFSLLKSFGVGKAAKIFPRETRLFTARFTMCPTASGRVVKKTR